MGESDSHQDPDIVKNGHEPGEGHNIVRQAADALSSAGSAVREHIRGIIATTAAAGLVGGAVYWGEVDSQHKRQEAAPRLAETQQSVLIDRPGSLPSTTIAFELGTENGVKGEKVEVTSSVLPLTQHRERGPDTTLSDGQTEKIFVPEGRSAAFTRNDPGNRQEITVSALNKDIIAITAGNVRMDVSPVRQEGGGLMAGSAQDVRNVLMQAANGDESAIEAWWFGDATGAVQTTHKGALNIEDIVIVQGEGPGGDDRMTLNNQIPPEDTW
ncbi:MAG: hypothetical protein J2P36_13890 [Ktedonobacteraceae bacterium]|nr:hypothetical protein [Ktedonobacteraceae bacterium]